MVARAWVGLSLGAAACLWLAPSAVAAESITAYDIQAEVTAEGSLDVRERITYDFGADERRGIFRTLPLWSELPMGHICPIAA